MLTEPFTEHFTEGSRPPPGTHANPIDEGDTIDASPWQAMWKRLPVTVRWVLVLLLLVALSLLVAGDACWSATFPPAPGEYSQIQLVDACCKEHERHVERQLQAAAATSRRCTGKGTRSRRRDYEDDEADDGNEDEDEDDEWSDDEADGLVEGSRRPCRGGCREGASERFSERAARGGKGSAAPATRRLESRQNSTQPHKGNRMKSKAPGSAASAQDTRGPGGGTSLKASRDARSRR